MKVPSGMQIQELLALQAVISLPRVAVLPPNIYHFPPAYKREREGLRGEGEGEEGGLNGIQWVPGCMYRFG